MDPFEIDSRLFNNKLRNELKKNRIDKLIEYKSEKSMKYKIG